MKPVVAITVGDYNGIGPEIILKSISRREIHRTCTPILVGPASAFLFYARRLKLKVELLPVSIDYGDAHDIKQTLAYRRSPVPLIPLVESSQLPRSAVSPGKTSAKAGNVAARAIEEAVCLAKAGIAKAIVTAPVSKKAMHRARVNFPGQTEMLQYLTGSPRVAMMLVSRTMRVGLVTIHVPIRKIPKTLSRQLLREHIKTIHEALITDWRIRKPKLAVLGLNPHAGEEGDLGTEDIELITPGLRASFLKQHTTKPWLSTTAVLIIRREISVRSTNPMGQRQTVGGSTSYTVRRQQRRESSIHQWDFKKFGCTKG